MHVYIRQDHTDVRFQPMFFLMGHVSKFAKTGARRLKSHVTGHYREGEMIHSSAVPDETKQIEVYPTLVYIQYKPLCTADLNP